MNVYTFFYFVKSMQMHLGLREGIEERGSIVSTERWHFVDSTEK